MKITVTAIITDLYNVSFALYEGQFDTLQTDKYLVVIVTKGHKCLVSSDLSL